MPDIIEKYYNSFIHHGKESARVYLMTLDEHNVDETLNHINNLAIQNKYSKIFAKVPAKYLEPFKNSDFKQEAFVPKFYKGIEDAYFLAKYPFKNTDRHVIKDKQLVEDVLAICETKTAVSAIELSEGFEFEILKEADVKQMADLYKRVFKSYPFPIFKEEYLLQTMKEDVCYFGIKKQGTLIAISSAEMDREKLNAEMTDFAILPEYRGESFALYLLQQMESYIINAGFKTAYTIARSVSYGMNIAFAKCAYIFAGTLINNTGIAGSIESMNVWYKNLQE